MMHCLFLKWLLPGRPINPLNSSLRHEISAHGNTTHQVRVVLQKSRCSTHLTKADQTRSQSHITLPTLALDMGSRCITLSTRQELSISYVKGCLSVSTSQSSTMKSMVVQSHTIHLGQSAY